MNEEIYEGTPSQEDVLIGTNSGYNRYRRPDGSTYVHYPYSQIPTVTAYSAKDRNGNPIRTADGKLITGSTQLEADRKRFRYDMNHWVEANRRNTAHLPKDWRSKYTLSEGKEALTMTPFVGDALDLGNVYQDASKGDYGMAAIGLGTFVLPNFIEKPLKAIGRPIAKKFFDHVSDALHNENIWNTVAFLQDPIKNTLNYKDFAKRRMIHNRWLHYEPKPGNYTYNGPANSLADAVELTKNRFLNIIDDNNAFTKAHYEKLNSIPYGMKNLSMSPALDADKIWGHVNLQKHYPFTEALDGSDGFIDALKTYVTLNTGPGVSIKNHNYTLLRDSKLFKTDLSRAHAEAHERYHALDKYINPEVGLTESKKIFNFNHLPTRMNNYLSKPTELAARGNLLKNYFGFTNNNLKLTGDMLKYAAEHYVKDVGLDNNINMFFSGIQDWDAAAEWLNKYSFKQGGKLIKKRIKYEE